MTNWKKVGAEGQKFLTEGDRKVCKPSDSTVISALEAIDKEEASV